jgi:hypothetical protein
MRNRTCGGVPKLYVGAIIEMSEKEDKVHKQQKAQRKGSIPERTHWILRKMIRQRFEELVGVAPKRKSGRTPVRPPPSDIC